MIFILNFFFSSRRRYTILTCDWSSVVCSSDLSNAGGGKYTVNVPVYLPPPALERVPIRAPVAAFHRSEERRVGKGCRTRWSPILSQKQDLIEWNEPANPLDIESVIWLEVYLLT